MPPGSAQQSSTPRRSLPSQSPRLLPTPPLPKPQMEPTERRVSSESVHTHVLPDVQTHYPQPITTVQVLEKYRGKREVTDQLVEELERSDVQQVQVQSHGIQQPPPVAQMNAYRPSSSCSRDESIPLLKGPREQVRGLDSKRRQREREQQTARDSPNRQPSTPSSSGTFTRQNHSQTPENRGSPYHTSQGHNLQNTLHDPPALVKSSAYQAEVRAQQVQQRPFVVSWSLPPGATSTRTSDRPLPMQEEAEDDAGVGTRNGGPSTEKVNEPPLDWTPDKTRGVGYDSFRRPSHPPISILRKPPGDAMSMQSGPSYEPVPRSRAPTQTRGETRKSVKRRMLYISNPEPTSSDEETPTRGEIRKLVKRRALYISNPEPTSSDKETVGTPTRGETRKRKMLYISNPKPTSSDEETGGENYAKYSTYYVTPGQVYDERRAGAIIPVNNDDEADSALEDTGYDADVNDEKYGAVVQRTELCITLPAWKPTTLASTTALHEATLGRSFSSSLPKMYIDVGVQTPYDMQHNPESSPLPLLLAILSRRKPGIPTSSVVTVVTIHLMRTFLFTRNYANVTSQLIDNSDVENLLDFILYLLGNGRLSNPDTPDDANRRARRLMFKIVTKSPIIPRSLYVTGVNAKVDRDYINHGGFGFVFKGDLRGAPVALKALYKMNRNYDFCREALTWRSLRHKFVLPFLGIHDDELSSKLYLVSPYMKNGTLIQWRKKANPSTAEIQRCMLEVVEGVHYIHSEGIVHGDLRGDNVLLDDNFHVQIADFGLTRHSEATVTGSGALHHNFAAPELFGYWEDDDDEISESDDDDETTARTQKSDVYAFGCLFYETHYGAMPFASVPQMRIRKLVAQGKRPPRMEDPPLSDKAWKLIKRCWAQEAVRRPSMEAVLEKMLQWPGNLHTLS